MKLLQKNNSMSLENKASSRFKWNTVQYPDEKEINIIIDKLCIKDLGNNYSEVTNTFIRK